MSGNISNSYSSSVRNPVKTIYIGGSSTSSGGGGGTNYWTLNGNNIYNNNIGSVGINTTTPDISFNLDVSGSVRIRGDLLVDGSSTIIDTNILKVEDPLIQLGINNPSDLKAGGFYVEYRDVSNNKKYTGMVRPPRGSGYVLLNNSSIEPSDSYPDVSSVPTSYLSVERLGVNKSLSNLSSFYVDISGLTRIWTDRVIIGSNAGNTGQDSNTIAIGNNAGNSNQGLNSIAIGSNAAYYIQNPNAIAVGRSAGAIAQGYNTVAMGYMAGEASQNTGALSLGFQAGRTFQGTNSIAIGVQAGEINQGCNSIAIGNLAGQNNQCNNTIVLNASGSNLGTNNPNGLYIDPIRNFSNNKAVYYNTITKEVTYSDISNGGILSLPQGNVYGEYLLFNGTNWFVDGSSNVAIGYNSGRFNQDISSVAIGFESGFTGQSSNSVAIGNQAGYTVQGCNSIAIGLNAGKNNQGTSSIEYSGNSIAIGTLSGYDNQEYHSIAIGVNAGNCNQCNSSIAIGYYAGASLQYPQSIAIGNNAGNCNQNNDSIAIGTNSGQEYQSNACIAIGVNAGNCNQQAQSIAIGTISGQTNQGSNSIAIGVEAGRSNQLPGAIAIGFNAGISGEGLNAIAIGSFAGACNQGTSAIAIGLQAGQTNQGSGAISIGNYAGRTNQHANSIIINSSTFDLSSFDVSALYIAPIRNDIAPPASSTYPLFYGSSSKEVFYNNNVQLSGVNSGDSIEGMYGDGSDLGIILDGTYNEQSLYSTFNIANNSYNLTRDIYPSNLDLYAGYTLETSGYRIFCTGTIRNNGVIRNNGGHASGVTAGIGGTGGFFRAGGAGAAGLSTTTVLSAGTAPPVVTANTLVGNYGGRGACGRAAINAGLGNSATGITVPSAASGGRKIASSTSAWIAPYQINNAGATYQLTPSMGGGSGAKSIQGSAATSGGGGGGGGIMYIAAYDLSGDGLFQCLGGNGGNAGGTGGNFGGGGGGAGGIIVLYTRKSVYQANQYRFSVAGGLGGSSVALGSTPTYPLAYPGPGGNGTTNTGLIGPSGVGYYLLPFTPTRNISINTLYVLTVCTVDIGSERPTILGVSGLTANSIWRYVTRNDFSLFISPSTNSIRMELWVGLIPPTLTGEDFMNNTNIRIQFNTTQPVTYRAMVDEIQNILIDPDNVIVKSTTMTSAPGLSITTNLGSLATTGNMAYTVVARVQGSSPVAGAGNTLIQNTGPAYPQLASQVSIQASNTQTWTTSTIAGAISIEIAQPIAMESGSPGCDGRVIVFGQQS